MKKIVRMITAIVAGVAMVAAVSACGSSDSSKQSSGNASGDKVITVVASTNVWGSLAKELGGKYVDVTSILSSTGVDAHDYEPTTSDIAKFENAQVAIVNGAGYDAWASKATSNKQIVIDAAQEGGKKTGDNPHVWFSSKVRVSTADAITAAYEKLMPEHKAEFQKLNEQWQAKEQDLEQEMKEVAEDDKHLSYAATESIADYLAQDLGLTDNTPEGYKNATANESEPSSADINNFMTLLKKGDVNMVIENSQEPSNATDEILNAADSGNIPVVDITEQMPGKYKSMTDWIKDIVKQVQEAQQSDK